MDDERGLYTSSSSLMTETKIQQLTSLTLVRSPDSDIPVIDLSLPDEELVVRAVVKASEEWGIFQVVNHGIPTELIRQFQVVGKQFFELPASEKEALARSADPEKLEGYDKKYIECIKAWDGHLFHKIWPPSSINYKYWPKNPPEYREVNIEYTRHMKKLTEKILGLLSTGLGLRRTALIQSLGGETAEYMIRINYYPPCPQSELVLGVAAHTDFCGLTLLVPNDVPGLQVFKGEQWFDVNYINSAVVVIIGDQMMRMSNGRYKSVLHRATLDKEKTRISWPVFVGPRQDLLVGPLSELTGDENPPKFETLLYKDYVSQKIGNWDAQKKASNILKTNKI